MSSISQPTRLTAALKSKLSVGVSRLPMLAGPCLQFTRSISRDSLAQEQYKRSMANMLKREWKVGDVYAPHDLSAAENRKWMKKKRTNMDVFDVLNVNPLSLYKNIAVMGDFVSGMGRIRPRTETGLRPVNQRKIAKAVKRAIALGLMPSVHKHPEILKRNERRPF